MRTVSLIPLMLLLGAAVAAHGQGASPSRLSPPTPPKKELREAAEKLRQAKENLNVDQVREAAAGLVDQLPPGVGNAASSAMQNAGAQEGAAEALKSAAQQLLPEARKFLDKPQEEKKAAPAAPAAPEGPQPQALKPLTATSTASRVPVLDIEADRSVFDQKSSILIYTGHVRARHPQFYIECEELEVHLVQEEKPKKGEEKKKPVKADPVLTDEAKKAAEKKNSGVKKAIATGPMVTILKRSDEGDIQKAHCKRAVYEGATGDIIMSLFPQVQRGDIVHIATQADTVMKFDQNGRLHTTGRTRTVKMGEESSPSAAPQPVIQSREP